MTWAELFDLIRDDLGDETTPPEFSDTKLLRQAARAQERAAHLVQKYRLAFGVATATISLEAETVAYDLPADFRAPLRLMKADGRVVELVDVDFLPRISGADEAQAYCILAGQAVVTGAPQAAQDLTLYYWPTLAAPTATTAETPWDGKLDYIMADYIVARLNNRDGMTTNLDGELLKDMETKLLDAFLDLQPGVGGQMGWNT